LILLLLWLLLGCGTMATHHPSDDAKDKHASFLKLLSTRLQATRLLDTSPQPRTQPVSEAGVSLAFLRRLASTYAEVQDQHHAIPTRQHDNETTAAFVARVVQPLTKARRCR
jgi:hypothetical protein